MAATDEFDAGQGQVLQQQRHVLGPELPDPADAEGRHEVLAHRPRTHLQRAGRQLAAAMTSSITVYRNRLATVDKRAG